MAATNVQSAINSLQSQEDLKATSANLTIETTRATTAEVLLQSEIDGERSPFRMTTSGTVKTVSIAPAKGTRTDSAGNTSTLIAANGSLVSDFPGATVDFSAGTITYTGGVPTPGSFTRISFAGQASKYAKYAIVILPGSPNSVLILNGSVYGTTAALASEPAFSGGILVGFVAVQDNGSAGTGTINNILQVNLEQAYASGSGSGSGSGSPLDPQADETFVYYTRSDFSVDTNKFVGSTTGTDQTLGLGKVVLAATQTFISKDLTGPQLYDDLVGIYSAQARLVYNIGKVDKSPTIEFTRDGGASWQTSTVTLPGARSSATYDGNTVIGDVTYSPASAQLYTGGTTNGLTTTAARVAAIFTPSYRTLVNSFQLYVSTAATSGSFVGKIYSVTAGTPQTVLATSAETYAAGQDITTTKGYKTFSFPQGLVLTAGTQYALVIEGTGATATVDQALTQTGSSSASFTAGWAAAAANLAYTLSGSGLDLRIRITSATAASELTGFGVNFVQDQSLALAGDASFEERFLTSTEASTGLITLVRARFTPGAHQLQINHGGHIFIAPDFVELSGSQVQFPAGYFQPGDYVRFYTGFGLVDGSSASLSKFNGLFELIVGSASQAASGIATHSTIQSAINAAAPGARITLMQGTYAENISIDRELMLMGKGRSSIINGTVTFTTAATGASLKFCKILDNTTINISAAAVNVSENWIASGKTVLGGTNAFILNIGE